LPPAVKAGYLAPYDSWAHRVAVHRFVQDIPMSPDAPAYKLMEWMGAELHRLADVPTLIGWGMKDFVFTPKFLAEFRRLLPKAAVHEYADANHLVLEDAADDLIPRIRDFAAKHGSQGR